ncbi:MAG: cell division protein FtsZ [Bacteroidales bacterium]|nr:cell division protein FtsZ [Bacteroidales bacterium]MCF8454338.1 cell division protein FtsZ [Bacteroidales bacterium]
MQNNTQHTTDFDGYLPEDLLNFAFPEHHASELKIIGVGGGGSNAVNHMHAMGVNDVQLIVCNTDAQALRNSPVSTKIQLGQTLTRGRGAGSKPEIGREAAIESIDEILNKVRDNTDMVFITAGMGGGTGTGAAPVIAKRIKELGILTVAIVTIPFKSEIGNRIEHARKGIEDLNEVVDALIIIENEKLNISFADLPLSEAFTKADEILAIAAKSIVEIIKVHGVWNVDFNDIKTVMSNSHVALMGSGMAEGKNRAMDAVEMALNSPLISSNNISDAKNILINIISGEKEILMGEHQQICDHIQKISGQGAEHFIIGSARDKSLGDNVKVTLIATGFSTQSVDSFKEKVKIDLDPEPENVDKPPIEPENNPVQEETKPIDSNNGGGKRMDADQNPKKEKKEKKEQKIDIKAGLQKMIKFFDDDVD